MKIEYTRIEVFKCPRCGAEYDSLTAMVEEDDYVWGCYRCGFVFARGKDAPIPEEFIIEKEVEAVRCDSCGRLITLTPSNMILGTPFKAVACPICREPSRTGVSAQHLLGIFYRGKWREPEFFMRKRGANGLTPAMSMRDRITAWLIAGEAKLNDDPSIRPGSIFDKGTLLKLLWVKGEAAGFYTYTVGGAWRIPCMHIIVVRREHRRKGFGTFMIRDFLRSTSAEKVGFEAPNRVVCEILLKLGELEKDGDVYRSKGKVVFFSGM